MSGYCDNKRSQMARPIPLFPPVTRIRFMAMDEVEAVDDADMAVTLLGT